MNLDLEIMKKATALGKNTIFCNEFSSKIQNIYF